MFQANVVDGGTIAFDSLVYQNNQNLDPGFIQQHLTGVVDKLDDYSKKFVETAVSIYEKVTSSEVAAIARSALDKAAGILHPNTITVVPIDKLHEASPYMQRWIMAQPELRQLYVDDKCDGYYGTYNDLDPEQVGVDHYDYRRVTDGVVQYHPEEDHWFVQFHTEELLDERDELNAFDKDRILETWEHVRIAIAEGKDPSNPDGGDL